MLDSRLDVDKALAHRVVALHGITQKVFQHLAGVAVLKEIYSICHCRMSLLVLQMNLSRLADTFPREA